MAILCGYDVKKISLENVELSVAQGEKLRYRVVYQSLASPPPPPPAHPIRKQGQKDMNTALNMLCIPWKAIWCGHNIERNFQKLRFLSY